MAGWRLDKKGDSVQYIFKSGDQLVIDILEVSSFLPCKRMNGDGSGDVEFEKLGGGRVVARGGLLAGNMVYWWEDPVPSWRLSEEEVTWGVGGELEGSWRRSVVLTSNRLGRCGVLSSVVYHNNDDGTVCMGGTEHACNVLLTMEDGHQVRLYPFEY